MPDRPAVRARSLHALVLVAAVLVGGSTLPADAVSFPRGDHVDDLASLTTEPDDFISRLPEGMTLEANLAREAAAHAFADVGADRVRIARDDDFPDSLAAGGLLDDSPLLLVSGDGPLSDTLTQFIADLGASRATILGGTAAVGHNVEEELGALDLEVSRLAGGTRL